LLKASPNSSTATRPQFPDRPIGPSNQIFGFLRLINRRQPLNAGRPFETTDQPWPVSAIRTTHADTDERNQLPGLVRDDQTRQDIPELEGAAACRHVQCNLKVQRPGTAATDRARLHTPWARR
jgi:hypothetical protein